ncbi:MAG: FprA family A-type flavoprotein [bacterium]
MPAVEIKPQVYWIGVNDRTTDLFEGLWPITEEGVSYNSYIIQDEKNAVIDLVKSMKTDNFLDQIDEVIPLQKLDYLIINHMEPDHTGMLKTLSRIAPDVTIIGSPKSKDMIQAFYGISENIKIVEDGEELKLGSKTLTFYHAPFVHWPETMVTYDNQDKILFSCDAFGSYGALRGAIFDDEYKDQTFYEKEALRYYVNIVANFSKPVLNAIDKLSSLDIKTIAPSHGLIWRKDPSRIVELYKKWAEYATDECEPGVTLLYSTMYGNTEEMMNEVAHGISSTGMPVEIFDVSRIHVSYILPYLWTQKGVMIGAPTYEGKLFPSMKQVLEVAAHKHIRNKVCAYFGSYGWSGGALRQVKKIAEAMKWEFIDSLPFQGGVDKELLNKGRTLGKKFAEYINK